MPAHDRLKLARDSYGAYESGDRRLIGRAVDPCVGSAIEDLLTDDFTFYFERCWPNSELIEAFDFKRLVEVGNEVVVTYESRQTDGRRFRNTEILTFEGDKICRAEVYFGWNLE